MRAPPEPVDRREILPRFQLRLRQVMARSELNQTDFAKAVGLDRSTLSQLLAVGANRLPRVESIAAIAQIGNVSLDWLLGLSQRERSGADLLAESLRIERDAPSPLDERLLSWLTEAAGYRIRRIPTTFPDVLKPTPSSTLNTPNSPRSAHAAGSRSLNPGSNTCASPRLRWNAARPCRPWKP